MFTFGTPKSDCTGHITCHASFAMSDRTPRQILPEMTHWPFGDIAAQVVFLTWPGKLVAFTKGRQTSLIMHELTWIDVLKVFTLAFPTEDILRFFRSFRKGGSGSPDHIAPTAVENSVTLQSAATVPLIPLLSWSPTRFHTCHFYAKTQCKLSAVHIHSFLWLVCVHSE